MKSTTTILLASALLFVSSFAGANTPTEWAGPSSIDGVELLSDSDLLLLTGTGLFRDVACGIADGVAGAGVIVGGAAYVLGATVPPVGIVVFGAAGLGSLTCALTNLFGGD